MLRININHSTLSTRTSQRGVTLIELMIAVVVFSILSALAYPSYQGHVRKARRSDAEATLLDIGGRMGRHLYSNGSFNEDLTALGFAVNGDGEVVTEDGHYLVSIVPETVQCPITSCYILQAVPQGNQAKDGLLILTSANRQLRDRNLDGDTDDNDEDSWR